MVFFDQDKERYNWDNSDLDDNAVTAEVNTSTFNKLPAKLPGIDLEIDNNNISVVTPKIDQSDAERIHESTTNSFFIPEGNNSGSAVVAALVGDTPLGGGISHWCRTGLCIT